MFSKKLVSLICAGASVLSIGLTTLSAEETDPNQSTNAPAETNQADQDAEVSAGWNWDPWKNRTRHGPA